MDMMRSLGATHVSICASGSKIPHMYEGTLPDELNKHHNEVLRYIDNPRRQYCRMSSAPCLTGSEFQSRWENMPPELIDFDQKIAKSGGKSASLVPVNGIEGLDWGAVVFRTDLDGDHHEKMWRKNHPANVMVAHLGFRSWWKMINEEQSQQSVLSKREQECLSWLAKGFRNDKIAEKLNLSPATVEFHFKNARQKLRSKTRAQALAVALKAGFITP